MFLRDLAYFSKFLLNFLLHIFKHNTKQVIFVYWLDSLRMACFGT